MLIVLDSIVILFGSFATVTTAKAYFCGAPSVGPVRLVRQVRHKRRTSDTRAPTQSSRACTAPHVTSASFATVTAIPASLRGALTGLICSSVMPQRGHDSYPEADVRSVPTFGRSHPELELPVYQKKNRTFFMRGVEKVDPRRYIIMMLLKING